MLSPFPALSHLLIISSVFTLSLPHILIEHSPTPSFTLFLIYTFSRMRCHTLSSSHAHTLPHTYFHNLSHTFSYTYHPLSYILFIYSTLSHSQIESFTFSLSHTHSPMYTHTHTYATYCGPILLVLNKSFVRIIEMEISGESNTSVSGISLGFKTVFWF